MRIGLHITPESWKRLGVFSTMENRSQSEIVDELIRCHLKKYTVSVRSAMTEDLASPTPEVSTT
jgi:hypothetical protein